MKLFLDMVESYDLENSPNVSSSSYSSSKSSSSSSQTSVVSVGRSLQLFGVLCCRLSASPYSKSEAVRTGKVSITLVETGDLVKDCFIRLGDWKLEIWSSVSQFRSGNWIFSLFLIIFKFQKRRYSMEDCETGNRVFGETGGGQVLCGE